MGEEKAETVPPNIITEAAASDADATILLLNNNPARGIFFELIGIVSLYPIPKVMLGFN